MDLQKNMSIIRSLQRPEGRIDMVLDTDAYNEIDDQYAIAYALKSEDKLNVKAIYAAPFSNKKAENPEIGMEKSFDEIKNILTLIKREDMLDKIYRGSRQYLPDATTPVISEAAKDLVSKAMEMPEDKKLYVVAIGAITNVASAILLNPEIIHKIVVVWLGGHSFGWKNTREFNCHQDKHAVRVVFDCGVPLVQIPCMGVTSHLLTTEPELRHYLKGKNELCDYLYKITCEEAIFYNYGKVWSKEIWDIVTIAWLVGGEEWMEANLVHSPIVTFDDTYSYDPSRHFILQVQRIERDYIFEDLFNKLTN